jgi:hypothetical protein
MVGHRGQDRRDGGLGPDEGRRTFQVNSFVRVGVWAIGARRISFPKMSQDVPGVLLKLLTRRGA